MNPLDSGYPDSYDYEAETEDYGEYEEASDPEEDGEQEM